MTSAAALSDELRSHEATGEEITVRPMGTHMILLPLREVYRGLIHIPETAKQPRGTRGLVVSMGPGMLMKNGNRWPMPDCEPGDVVIFKPEGCSEVMINGKQHVIVRDVNVIAVLED
jgi:co-chaperonin GroES (HSP10)